jgi:hypothetical protein
MTVAPCRSCLFFFLSFKARKRVRDKSMAMTAAPTPIPARAPALSTCDSGEEGRVVGGTKLVFEADVVMEDGGVVDVADGETGDEAETGIEDVDLDGLFFPTVAGSTNKLQVTLQQFSSPQHQLSSPHFLTGAFSSCYC